MEKLWTEVDAMLEAHLAPPESVLIEGIERAKEAEMPAIAVTPLLGKLLMILAQSIGAKRILEIGTLAGFSTTWMARALPPDGKLISLEFEPKHAAVARENVDAAGVGDKIEILVGPALDLLPQVEGPFDLVFIDADKENNPHYYAWARKLTRSGSLILVDNVVRDGKIVDSTITDPHVQGVRDLLKAIREDQGVEATAIQMVSGKEYDGFALIRVN
ncbi:MAG: O-methyltransferase [Armatimonadetes bacterium]|nr:O-methyltransferase [Armatimonadota bacterium]